MVGLGPRKHVQRISDVGFAAATRQRLGEEIWDSCFKFTFVRNSWDRAVSNWKYLEKVVPIGGFEDFLSRLEDGTLCYSPHDQRTNCFLWHVEPLRPKSMDAMGNDSKCEKVGARSILFDGAPSSIIDVSGIDEVSA